MEHYLIPECGDWNGDTTAIPTACGTTVDAIADRPADGSPRCPDCMTWVRDNEPWNVAS